MAPSLAMAAGAPLRVATRARSRPETAVVFVVDVEPDLRIFHPDDPPGWTGLEGFIDVAPDLRARLEEATGAPVAFTWFLRMDPQIERTWGSAGWVVETYRDALEELAAQGDELGLHTHTWRWVGEPDLWVADYEDAEWTEHCVRLGLDTFEAVLGRPSRSYRGGDYYLDSRLLAHLAERGVRADVTVEPGRPPQAPPQEDPARGLLPDYRSAPTGPYRSSPGLFPQPDPAATEGPVLLPVYSPPGRHGSRFPLSAETTPGRFYLRLAAGLAREAPTVIATPARSDATVAGRWSDLSRNLEHLARHSRMRFVTASDAADRVNGAG